MRTQAQMGQHASQGALALGAGVRAAALVLDGRAQGWGNGAPVFDSSRNCSSAFGRSLFLFHARGFPSLGQRIGRLSLAASAPGRHLSRRDTSLAGNLGSSARALPHFLSRSPDHVGCNRSEQAKNHVEILSSTPVGVDAQHGPKGFRSVRTPFREVGNEFRG